MKKRTFAAVLAVLLLLSSFAACGQQDTDPAPPTAQENGAANGDPAVQDTPGEPREIVVRALGDPFSFTPNFMPDEMGYEVHQNLFSRLVKLDVSKSEPIPDLAESWHYSDDVMTLTFYLRQNAYWHDGVPVTSADVKYTFDTIMANPTYFFNSSMAIVDSIEAPDDHTVIFHLNTPDASFVAFLGWYATFILPKHIYDVGIPWADNPAGQNPIGSGPFMFYSYSEGESVILQRFPDYFEGPAALDRVIFAIIPDEATAVQALLNGEIDFMSNIPPASLPELQAHPHLNVFMDEWPSPIRLVFNMEDELAGNLAVRRAIAYAINRDQISTMAYFGLYTPEYNMYPSFVAWATNNEDTAPSLNVEAGIQMLEDAGFERRADGYFFDFELDYFPMLTGGVETALLLQSQLSAVGIRLELNSLEIMAYIMRAEAGEFQMHLISGFLGPDPSAYVMRFGSGLATNWGRYANAEFDEYIMRGNSVADQAQRAIYYRAAQRIMAEELPQIPLVNVINIEAAWDHFINLPIHGEGRWGWQEWTFTDIVS